MRQITRRSFLAAPAVLAASPGFAQRTPPRGLPAAAEERPAINDVAIVGAGAAGIAAARRLIAAGRRVYLIEAAAEVGGRCVTDTKTFGLPFDRGARWIYTADINPVAKLALEAKLDIYPAPAGERIRIGRRYAREAELEDYLGTLVRANNAIAEAARGRVDVTCAQALPKDIGQWRGMIDFFLGPFASGKELTEISAMDFARGLERDNSTFCRQGFGALLARLSNGIPAELSSPVTRLDWSSRSAVEVEHQNGSIVADAAIVTVSTNVLLAGRIRFVPELPKRTLDAASRLKLGSYDHITLELPDNPLGLRADELVFEKSTTRNTAALFANASGTTLCSVDVAGNFGRDLSAKSESDMVTFALDWLTGLYGNDMKKAVRRSHATRWNAERYVLGAASSAAPGGQGARKILMEPLNNRLWLAGEAAHETLWGTVGGAWESGERAAEQILKVTKR